MAGGIGEISVYSDEALRKSGIRLGDWETSDIRHLTSDFYPPAFGHRPIYIRGEAATTTLNPEP